MAERVASTVEGAPPVVRVEGTIRHALAPAALARLTAEDLAHFLAGRRWFAAKGGTLQAARVASVIPLDWDDGSFAIARLDVEAEAGVRESYQLPLAVRQHGAPTAVLAQVESPDGDGILFDAVEDAAFRRHLADAFARGARFEVQGASWIIEPIGKRTLVVPLEAPIELLTAEQSNTSIRFAEEAILKLFRKLEPGPNPDVEISTFLAMRANFPYAPAVFGTARFEDRNVRGGKLETTLSGMLQEFMPKAVDGWSYVVEGGGRRAGGGEVAAPPPAPRRPPPPFAAEARRLGEVTRALHDALASAGPDEPDFVPEVATPSDVAAWGRATEERVGNALALLERQLDAGRLPKQYVDEARALAARRAEFLDRVRRIADAVRGDAGLRIRHHGDYHLGQVLRTAAGEFMIIDFEGEPARPLAERRRKHSALRDVASMLRSFAYAGAVLRVEGGGERAERPADDIERHFTTWEREVREAFLRGYALEHGPGAPRSTLHPPPSFLPKKQENIDRLITLFETEKVFYELAYELNNRPDWVWIPMRALRAG